MVVYRVAVMNCDGCGAEFEDAQPGVHDLRRNARRAGWLSTGHTPDLCPRCRRREKNR